MPAPARGPRPGTPSVRTGLLLQLGAGVAVDLGAQSDLDDLGGFPRHGDSLLHQGFKRCDLSADQDAGSEIDPFISV